MTKDKSRSKKRKDEEPKRRERSIKLKFPDDDEPINEPEKIKSEINTTEGPKEQNNENNIEQSQKNEEEKLEVEEKKENKVQVNVKESPRPTLQRSNSQPLPKIDQDELIALAGADPAKLVELLRQRQTPIERRFIPVGNPNNNSQSIEKEHSNQHSQDDKKEEKKEGGNDKQKSNVVIIDEKIEVIKSDVFNNLKKLFSQAQPKSEANLNYHDYSKTLLQISNQLEDLLKFTKNGLEKCINCQYESPNFYNDETFSQINHNHEKIKSYFDVPYREISSKLSMGSPPPPPPPFMNAPPPPPPPGKMNTPILRVNRSTSSGALTHATLRKHNLPQFDPNAEVINAIKGGIKLRSVGTPKAENKEPTNNDNSAPNLLDKFPLRKTNFEEKKMDKNSADTDNVFGVRLRTVPREDFNFESKSEKNDEANENVLPSRIPKSRANRPTSWGPVSSHSLVKKAFEDMKDDPFNVNTPPSDNSEKEVSNNETEEVKEKDDLVVENNDNNDSKEEKVVEAENEEIKDEEKKEENEVKIDEIEGN